MKYCVIYDKVTFHYDIPFNWITIEEYHVVHFIVHKTYATFLRNILYLHTFFDLFSKNTDVKISRKICIPKIKETKIYNVTQNIDICIYL